MCNSICYAVLGLHAYAYSISYMHHTHTHMYIYIHTHVHIICVCIDKHHRHPSPQSRFSLLILLGNMRSPLPVVGHSSVLPVWYLSYVSINLFPRARQHRVGMSCIHLSIQSKRSTFIYIYIYILILYIYIIIYMGMSQNTVSNPGSLTRGYDSWVWFGVWFVGMIRGYDSRTLI